MRRHREREQVGELPVDDEPAGLQANEGDEHADAGDGRDFDEIRNQSHPAVDEAGDGQEEHHGPGDENARESMSEIHGGLFAWRSDKQERLAAETITAELPEVFAAVWDHHHPVGEKDRHSKTWNENEGKISHKSYDEAGKAATYTQ